jgi:hypothetical protein
VPPFQHDAVTLIEIDQGLQVIEDRLLDLRLAVLAAAVADLGEPFRVAV